MIGASGGSSGFLFLIILAFVVLYFIIIRPQRRRQMNQQRMLNQLNVGDEIVTAGGIYGEITSVADDDVMVRIAPDLEVRVARRAIAGVTPAATGDHEGEAAVEPVEELERPQEPDPPEPTPGT